MNLVEKIKTLVKKEEAKNQQKKELKVEQDKIAKLETHGLSYFQVKIFFGDDCF